MGLDFLHRICKIIHTDLKPENCVLSLSKSELDEVLKRGQISTMNKTIKTMDVVSNNFFLPKGSLLHNQTLLQNVDTTGMTKLQKKKLKKKIKKKQKEEGVGEETKDGKNPELNDEQNDNLIEAFQSNREV